MHIRNSSSLGSFVAASAFVVFFGPLASFAGGATAPASTARATAPGSASDVSTAKVERALVSSSTLGAFIEKIGPSLEPVEITFLQAKGKGLSSKSYLATSLSTSTNKSHSEFLIAVGTHKVTFELGTIDAEGDYHFAVNHHKLVYHPDESPEVMWNKIKSSLPTMAQNTWAPFSLLTAAVAEADESEQDTGAVITPLAYGANLNLAGLKTCDSFIIYAGKCDRGDLNEADQSLPAARKFAAKVRIVNRRCGGAVDRLRQCLSTYLGNQPAAPPADARGNNGKSPGSR